MGRCGLRFPRATGAPWLKTASIHPLLEGPPGREDGSSRQRGWVLRNGAGKGREGGVDTAGRKRCGEGERSPPLHRKCAAKPSK